MAWLFGGLLLAWFVSLPLLGPVLAKLLSGTGMLRGPVLLSAFVTVYGALFLFLVAELLLALDGQRVWPLRVGHPFNMLAFFGAFFVVALLITAPVAYLGSAGRRAGVRYASAHGLTFEPTGGPWSISADLAPWTLQWKVELKGGGFIAAATTSHLGRDQRVAYTYRTVGTIPGACTARGAVTNGEKVWRKPGAGEQEISVRDVRFLVPSAGAVSWRILLEQAAGSSPLIAPDILYIFCDDTRASVALGATLREEVRLAELEALLRSIVERSPALARH